MGHKKKNQQSRSLQQQAYDILNRMLKEGEGRSKHADKAKGITDSYIYSFSTYKSYIRHVRYFCVWMKQNHPEITTLKKAKVYIREWLEERERSGKYSAYTLHLETAAIAKLYGIKPDDKNRYVPPTRHREDIKRSRYRTETDRHFSEGKNQTLVNFCKGTGLRRAGLTSIRPDCLFSSEDMPSIIDNLLCKEKDSLSEREAALIECYNKISIFKKIPNYYIFVCEKGGKWRLAPVLPRYEKEVVERISATPAGQKVWLHVPKACDVHGYRAEYATELYKIYARDIDSIQNRKEIYVCRKNDLKGLKLDKKAMLVIERSLGHESQHTFAEAYAYRV